MEPTTETVPTVVKRKMLKPGVHVIGIRQRCRKVDHHFLEMAAVPPETDPAQIERDAIALVRREMKEFRKAVLSVQPVEIGPRGEMSFWCFSDTKTDITEKCKGLAAGF